jgi:uncharacterized protein with GYD domain
MANYIVLIKSTQKGTANPQTLAGDVETANEFVAKMGGKLLDWNLTMGPYDAVAKVEFQDDMTLAAFCLAIAATGNQETTTMRAFSVSEVKKIIEKIPT